MSFPRNDDWDYFVESMKHADVWYDVIDDEVGDILDYMYNIMDWAKRNKLWGEPNDRMIERAKEDWVDDLDE